MLRSCGKKRNKKQHRQNQRNFFSDSNEDSFRRQQSGSYDSVESQASSLSQDKNVNQNPTTTYNSNSRSNSDKILQFNGSSHSVKHSSPPQGILRKQSIDGGLGDALNSSIAPSVKKKYSFSDPVVTRVSKIDNRPEVIIHSYVHTYTHTCVDMRYIQYIPTVHIYQDLYSTCIHTFYTYLKCNTYIHTYNTTKTSLFVKHIY